MALPIEKPATWALAVPSARSSAAASSAIVAAVSGPSGWGPSSIGRSAVKDAG
jgi:hypothetical protein